MLKLFFNLTLGLSAQMTFANYGIYSKGNNLLIENKLSSQEGFAESHDAFLAAFELIKQQRKPEDVPRYLISPRSLMNRVNKSFRLADRYLRKLTHSHQRGLDFAIDHPKRDYYHLNVVYRRDQAHVRVTDEHDVVLGEFSLTLERDGWRDSLNQDQLLAMQLARRYFNFSVLKGEINGIERTIVMAGESHAKGYQAKTAGLNLLQAFRNQGLELALHFKKIHGSRILRPLMRTMYFTLSKLGIDQGSSLYDAIHLDILNSYFHRYPQDTEDAEQLWLEHEERLYDYARQWYREKSGIDEIQDEKFQQLKAFFPLWLKMIKRPKKLGLPFRASSPHVSSNVLLLEKGHKPSWMESASVIWLIQLLAMDVAGMIGHNPRLVSAYFLANLYYVYAGVVTYSTFHLEPTYRNIFAPIIGLLEPRNDTWVKNTVEYFRDHPNKTTMLKLFGSAHGKGLVDTLVKFHGFKKYEISFD